MLGDHCKSHLWYVRCQLKLVITRAGRPTQNANHEMIIEACREYDDDARCAISNKKQIGYKSRQHYLVYASTFLPLPLGPVLGTRTHANSVRAKLGVGAHHVLYDEWLVQLM